MYDVIILGAGPAGISAALYSKMAGADVLVLYFGKSTLDKADKIENYYGFIDGIDAKTLYENGIEQAKNLDIKVKNEEVLNIEKQEKEFSIMTDKDKYKAKSVILATGNKKLRPNINGITKLEGKGISYCAVCDGFFYKNKNAVVIGNGEFAKSEAEYLQNIASNVKILTNGEKINIDFNFEVITTKIKEICGHEKVEQIEFEDGSKLDVDGIFIAQGEAGGVDFAKKMGIILNKDNIVVNENMQTNIEGLYACGNVTGGMLQICKATYEGAKAGLDAVKYIKNRKED